MLSLRRRQSGFTIAELITVCAVISLLAAVALPVARFGLRRQKEIELRDRLRKITDAIDRYHDLMTIGLPGAPNPAAAPAPAPAVGGFAGNRPGGATPAQAQVPGTFVRPAEMPALGSDGYPKDLEALEKGVKMSDGRTIRLLRERDLIDPITGRKEWITRSTTDDPETSSSDGNNVFEVHSTSTALSLDGKTRYNEW